MENQTHLTSRLARSSRLYKAEVNVVLKAHQIDLSSEMAGVLMELGKSDGKNQQALALIFKKDKAGITRIIKSLEKRNLISSSEDPTDRRRKNISLTPKGQQLQDRIEPLINDLRKAVLCGINASDRRTTERVLHTIVANLEKQNNKTIN